MTAALEGGEWSAVRPGRTLPLGKTRYPFYRRLGGPQGRSGRAEYLTPTGIRSRTIQPGKSVAIPTELPGPHAEIILTLKLCELSICTVSLKVTHNFNLSTNHRGKILYTACTGITS